MSVSALATSMATAAGALVLDTMVDAVNGAATQLNSLAPTRGVQSQTATDM